MAMKHVKLLNCTALLSLSQQTIHRQLTEQRQCPQRDSVVSLYLFGDKGTTPEMHASKAS